MLLSVGMRTHVDPITNLRRAELEACARVTKLNPSAAANDPAREGKHYEGMLAHDVRVGQPMVLVLGGKRRLVTSTIRKINPITSAMMEVETSNSRYYVRRLLPESLVETDDSAA